VAAEQWHHRTCVDGVGQLEDPRDERHYARLKGDHLAQAVALLPSFELEKKGAIRLVKSGNQGLDSGSSATKSAT
jgi:hypothetical protein